MTSTWIDECWDNFSRSYHALKMRGEDLECTKKLTYDVGVLVEQHLNGILKIRPAYAPAFLTETKDGETCAKLVSSYNLGVCDDWNVDYLAGAIIQMVIQLTTPDVTTFSPLWLVVPLEGENGRPNGIHFLTRLAVH